MFLRIKGLIKRIFNPNGQESFLSKLPSEDRDLIFRIRSKKLSYLSDKKLASLSSTCRTIEKSRIPGAFIEAGCALGGSAILIATIKNPSRQFLIFDVFGMIPSPTEEDTEDVHDRYKTIVDGSSVGIGGDRYYGYQENLYDIVKSNLTSFGIMCDQKSVSLIKGLVQDTMKIDHSIAFAHVDVDWHEPVKTCLERIFPRLSVGGSIILDDYHDWGGCRKATDEFLRGVTGKFVLDDGAGSLKITKISS